MNLYKKEELRNLNTGLMNSNKQMKRSGSEKKTRKITLSALSAQEVITEKLIKKLKLLLPVKGSKNATGVGKFLAEDGINYTMKVINSKIIKIIIFDSVQFKALIKRLNTSSHSYHNYENKQ